MIPEINSIIVSAITKFSIVIGSPRANSACDHVGVQLWVANLNFLYFDTRVIFTSIARVLMAFFAIFPTLFET